MPIINLLLYITAFIFIWLGSGLIVSSASKFSKKLKLSAFAFSFVFLGILTSTPEFSVGLQAVADNDAAIFVGNLLGGIIVLFLIVIPLLAVFGNGINLKHELDHKQLIVALGVISLPSILILDRKVTNMEGVIMIISYLILLFIIQRKNGIFDRDNEQLLDIKSYSLKDILKILLGLVIVFIASSLIVDKTIYFAEYFNISAFYISLIVIAVGTDLPELTLAVRSIISGKKDIAMGDYIGAAAVSTLLFGIFTLLHNGEVVTVSNFLTTFIFITTALSLFFFFSYRNQFLTRINGIFMIAIYVLFLAVEINFR